MKAKKLILLVLLFFSAGLVINAQTVNEAIEAYNQGIQLAKTDLDKAIAEMKKSIGICKEVGEEADAYKIQAENKVAEYSYNIGNKYIKEKNYNKAIEAFIHAEKVAKDYGVSKVEVKAAGMVPKLYHAIGTSFYKKEQFDKALEYYNKATDYDASYTKSQFAKVIIYQKQEDVVNYKSVVDQIINSKASAQDKAKAKKKGNVFMVFMGANAIDAKQYAQANEYLNNALAYDAQDAETYFRLAMLKNAESKFNDALTHVENAMKFEDGNDEKKARIYFEQGKAYKGLGNKAQACAAFNKAMVGKYTENAKYEIEHELKCNE